MITVVNSRVIVPVVCSKAVVLLLFGRIRQWFCLWGLKAVHCCFCSNVSVSVCSKVVVLLLFVLRRWSSFCSFSLEPI